MAVAIADGESAEDSEDPDDGIGPLSDDGIRVTDNEGELEGEVRRRSEVLERTPVVQY